MSASLDNPELGGLECANGHPPDFIQVSGELLNLGSCGASSLALGSNSLVAYPRDHAVLVTQVYTALAGSGEARPSVPLSHSALRAAKGRGAEMDDGKRLAALEAWRSALEEVSPDELDALLTHKERASWFRAIAEALPDNRTPVGEVLTEADVVRLLAGVLAETRGTAELQTEHM